MNVGLHADQVQSSLPERHVSRIVRKAECVLVSLSRSFVSCSPAIFIESFKAFVRPLLEYASPVWSPSLIKDIGKIEQVQRRATKRISTIRNFHYSERLRSLDLRSLESRRLIADLVEVFKMTHLSPCVSRKNFERCQFKTRGHAFKVKNKYCVHEFRRNFFTIRVIDAWNNLPAHVFNCSSIKAFRIAISSFL